MKRFLHRLSATIKTILGLPNYEAYLAWHSARCPGKTPLSRREFYDQCLQARYDRGAARRCC